MLAILVACSLHSVAMAQQPGTAKTESHPCLGVQHCTKAQGCTTEPASVTMDAQWRWTHQAAQGGAQNCFENGKWDASLCSDGKECAANCAVEALTEDDYKTEYGVMPSEGGVELKYKNGNSVGSRLYVMDNDDQYKLWKLKNREFSFRVDVSSLVCGLNGAVYFVEMDAAGGKGVGNNMAGAAYGTGYCDAQCPHDLKFIDGEANVKDWHMTDYGTPIGRYGACCTELDIWEANALSTAYTTHTCDTKGPKRCEGLTCGDSDKGDARYQGVCDKDGCDFNSYRMGATKFFGPGYTVDSTKPVYVVTQFLTTDGTDDGDLSEIRRLYVQDGKIIPNSETNISGFPDMKGDSITDDLCVAAKKTFGNRDDFSKKGGLKAMGEVLDRGMVLVLSLWDDAQTKMDWLDSATTDDGPTTQPGVVRGPCSEDVGSPSDLRSTHGAATVKYTDFRYGEIGSTFSGNLEPVMCAASPSSATTAPSQTAVAEPVQAPLPVQQPGTAFAQQPAVALQQPASLSVPPQQYMAPAALTSQVPPAAAPAMTASYALQQPAVAPAGFTFSAAPASSAAPMPPATWPAPSAFAAPAEALPPVAPSSATCALAYKQCGGKAWHGTTCCQTGCTCEVDGPFYSQCTPASSGLQCGTPAAITDGVATVLMRKNSMGHAVGGPPRRWEPTVAEVMASLSLVAVLVASAARRFLAVRTYERLPVPFELPVSEIA